MDTWWAKVVYNCFVSASVQGKCHIMTATWWTNQTLSEITGNLFVYLRVELMHILMDSSFLTVEFSDLFSQAVVGRSNTECIAFKPTNKQTRSRWGQERAIPLFGKIWNEQRQHLISDIYCFFFCDLWIICVNFIYKKKEDNF